MSSLSLDSLPARVIGGACLALFASIAVPLSAQEQSSWTVEARGGSSIPAGDLDELNDGGALLGLGVGYGYSSRVLLRLDGNFEMLNEDRSREVVLPRAYLWHLHAGVELALTDPTTSVWKARVRGGLGGTIYDTKRIGTTGDDFLDTNFSVSGALSLGRMVTEGFEVGGFGGINLIFTDKDRIREITDQSPILTPFSKASSFPLGIYVRANWSAIMF
jgi:hypothetical protein